MTEKKNRRGLVKKKGDPKDDDLQKYMLIYINELGLEKHKIFDYKVDVFEWIANNPLISATILLRGHLFELEYEKILSII